MTTLIALLALGVLAVLVARRRTLARSVARISRPRR